MRPLCTLSRSAPYRCHHPSDYNGRFLYITVPRGVTDEASGGTIETVIIHLVGIAQPRSSFAWAGLSTARGSRPFGTYVTVVICYYCSINLRDTLYSVPVRGLRAWDSFIRKPATYFFGLVRAQKSKSRQGT